MRYRNSFFNPTVFRSYLRRFWPLPVTVFGVEALALLLPLLRKLGRHRDDWPLPAVDGIYRIAFFMMLLLAASSILAAALVFRHIHSRRDIQFFHGLPVTRRCLYGTAYLTGYLMIALPMLLGILISMAAAGLSGAGDAVIALMELYGAGLGALTMFYSMGAVACCLAGQTFGAVLIYTGMHTAVMVITSCAGNLAALFMPGINTQNFLAEPREWLTPIIQLLFAVESQYHGDGAAAMSQYGRLYAQGFVAPGFLLIYAAVGVLLAAAGGALYRIRRAETAGEMVSFSPVRTLCKLFGALMVCAAGADLTLTYGLFPGDIPFRAVVAAVLIFGVLGWIIAEMVVRKTLRVFDRKALRSCSIFAAALLVLLGAGRLDVFGTVRYIPEPEQVQSASIWYNGYSVTLPPEDAAALHETVLQNREELNNHNIAYDNSFALEFLYNVGRSHPVRREYQVSRNGVIRQALNTLMEQPENIYQSWLGDREELLDEDSFYECHVSTPDEDRGFSYGLAVELHEAILRDIAAGNVEPCGFTTQIESGTVDFLSQDEDGNIFQESIPITADMEYTLAWLAEKGLTVLKSA